MASYIDQALVGGILSGVVLLVAVMWVLFAQNALWRIHLRTLAQAQLDLLSKRHGFVPLPVGFRAQIGTVGEIEGQPIVLLLKGGAKGVRANLLLGPRGEQRKFVEPIAALKGDLSGWIYTHLDVDEE